MSQGFARNGPPRIGGIKQLPHMQQVAAALDGIHTLDKHSNLSVEVSGTADCR
jgi:hypothetical protein